MTLILVQKYTGNTHLEDPASSGTLLAKALSIKALGSNSPKLDKLKGPLCAINWGISNDNYIDSRFTRVINDPDNVKVAVNKLATLIQLDANEGNAIQYTQDKDVALSWLNKGSSVVGRALLSGSCGEGISITKSKHADSLPDVPLYTLYIRKRDEYRVHVVFDSLLIQKKVKLQEESREERGISEVIPQIRNLNNGYVYTTNHHLSEEDFICISEVALKAIEILGLDFGAVDIIKDLKTGLFKVLEVNTAPGLSNVTLRFYEENFKEL